jgi:ABC-type branched-subunit amino acid transport system ATPase component
MAEGHTMTEAMPNAEPFFQARDIRKSFGSLQAVDGCSLEVEKGTMVALIGPNGAGKTTFFNIAAGAVAFDAGQIVFKGEDISRLKPHQRALKGLGRTFQITRVFPKMTLLENMIVASRHQHDALRRAMEYLELVRLAEKCHDYASDLSFGQQKLLELARILMLDPDLILLDEPAAGVNPTLLQSLLAFVHRLRDEWGKTFLIIEHNMDVVMGHCEKIIVMNAGKVIAEGTSDQIQSNEEVLEAYFGKHPAHAASREGHDQRA